MNIALFHHLPMTGGAARVLAEYVAHAREHDFTLYTRKRAGHELVTLDPRVRVMRRPLPDPSNRFELMQRLASLRRLGVELAEEIDGAAHDAVFCHASDFVKAPEVLPYLETPSLYYAPEPVRRRDQRAPSATRRGPTEWLDDHGLNPFQTLMRRADRRHVRGADLVVTHSRYTAECLQAAYGICSEVVKLGVDSSVFTPNQTDRDSFVLSVGALRWHKGHQFVIEALATLPRPRPRLVVIGDQGELRQQIEAAATSHGIELDVRCGVPLEEVVSAYRQAGVVACGQIDEPFGLVALEAMATATPVVAVAEGGLVESVIDGVTGLLTPRDKNAFGAAIAHVLSDRGLADGLGEAGVREASKWTWEETARGYNRLLERIAHRPT